MNSLRSRLCYVNFTVLNSILDIHRFFVIFFYSCGVPSDLLCFIKRENSRITRTYRNCTIIFSLLIINQHFFLRTFRWNGSKYFNFRFFNEGSP